jgi:hypothetical protein
MQVVTYLHNRFHERVSGGHLATPADLESAFDKALTQVHRCIRSGMISSSGGSARARLEKLEQELREERARALKSGSVDQEWFRATVRWVVEWVPDDELTLVAALGQIIRSVPPG